MFDFLASAGRKTLEAADIIDEQVEELSEEDQEALDDQEFLNELKEQDAANETKKYPVAVGRIAPVVFDPQDLLDNLTELFGTFKGVTRAHKFSCPDCDWSSQVDAATSGVIDISDDTCCPDCGYEDSVAEFYDGTDLAILTSRTPTRDEMLSVGALRRWDTTEGRIDELKQTFAELHGVKAFDSYRHMIHMVGVKHCSKRCADSGCTCGSSNLNPIRKLSEVEVTGDDDDDE